MKKMLMTISSQVEAMEKKQSFIQRMKKPLVKILVASVL
ncbi:MAG: hypothetical protein K0Q73_5024, partial [Paenibacillus sp.]|nr:hypothetical protein [Paenibacillus sp.]